MVETSRLQLWHCVANTRMWYVEDAHRVSFAEICEIWRRQELSTANGEKWLLDVPKLNTNKPAVTEIYPLPPRVHTPLPRWAVFEFLLFSLQNRAYILLQQSLASCVLHVFSSAASSFLTTIVAADQIHQPPGAGRCQPFKTAETKDIRKSSMRPNLDGAVLAARGNGRAVG